MTPTKKLNKKNLELNVNLSHKVKNGSIKVSENDLKNLGVGIVEEVVITKVGDEEGLTLMLFSDSHIKSGNVIMSISDANGMELGEGDKVTIKKLSDYNKSKKTTKIKSQQDIVNLPENLGTPAKSINNSIRKTKGSPKNPNSKTIPLIKKIKKSK
jgi:hypothetical protein